MFGSAGSHAKAIGLGVAGWSYMNDGVAKKIVDTGGKAIGVVDKGLDGAGKVLDMGNKALDKTDEKAPEMLRETGDALTGGIEAAGNGIGQAGGLFGGISNLLGSVFGGGLSSVLGLVAAGFMLFGNFGWLGKIGGMLLGALSLGMFGGKSQQPTQQINATNPQGQRAEADYTQEREITIPHEDAEENDFTVHRSR